jgi:SsrA-binding protein
LARSADAPVRVVTTNRKARHDYEILETLEAGLVLTGPEVKSLRAGRVSMSDAYGQIQDGEAFLINLHISPYDQAHHVDQDPRRRRKLLLHKREIRRLTGKIQERGLTLVPLRIYFRGPYAKVELALARGRKRYDKREAIARKDARREIDRVRARRHG